MADPIPPEALLAMYDAPAIFVNRFLVHALPAYGVRLTLSEILPAAGGPAAGEIRGTYLMTIKDGAALANLLLEMIAQATVEPKADGS